MSVAGFTELEDVLSRPKVLKRFPLLTPEAVAAYLAGVRARAQLISAVPHVFRYARDPDDEHLLNLTIAAAPDYLVTRDDDILDLAKPGDRDGQAFRALCPRVVIVTPVDFLAAMSPEAPA